MQRIKAFRSLDVFRGFAALWVVMDHSCVSWLDKHRSYYRQPIYAFSIHGQLGVVLFFVISGYCITAAVYAALTSGKSLARYGFERLRRIYPPYLFALVVTSVTNLALKAAENRHLIPAVHHSIEVGTSLTYWTGNLLLLQYELHVPFINMVFWSLCYEVAFYALMGVFLFWAQRISRSRGLHDGTLFLISAMAVSTVLALSFLITFQRQLFPFDSWHLFAVGGLLFFFLEMNASTVSSYTKGLRSLVWWSCGAVCLLTLAFAVFCQVGATDISYPSSKIKSLTAVLFCLLLASIRKFDSQITEQPLLKPLIWIGAFSYSLYLIHPIILPFVDIPLRRAGLDGSRYVFTFAAQLVVSITCGRMVFLTVERFFISKRQERRLESAHVLNAEAVAVRSH